MANMTLFPFSQRNLVQLMIVFTSSFYFVFLSSVLWVPTKCQFCSSLLSLVILLRLLSITPMYITCEYAWTIIIIMSCRQHGYLWPPLATSPYRSLPLAGLQGYILYPHIAAVCMFELVVLLLLGHMWGVHRSTSLMSSSLLLQHVWFI